MTKKPLPPEEILRILLEEIKRGNVRKITDNVEMENLIDKALTYLQRGIGKDVAYKSTSEKYEYGFFFEDGVIDKIKILKKCKSDMEVARILGINKGYLSRIINKKQPASAALVIRTVMIMGNIDGPWETIFKILAWREALPSNHPSNNMKKFKNEMDYETYSSSRREFEEEK